MTAKPTSSDKANQTMLALLIFGSLSFLAALLFYFTFIPGKISPSPEKWGQFGDYIGGTLNPILAFFSLCGVYHSIRLQIEANRETRLQFLREQFENRFFQLLGLLNEQRKGIGFSDIADAIKNSLRQQDSRQRSFTQRFSDAYKGATASHHITDYLQHIQNLLRFLQRGQNERTVTDDFFITAMGSLLPTDEKVVLFYIAVEDDVFRKLMIDIPILAGLQEDRVAVKRADFPDFDKLIPKAPTSTAQPAG